jgi:hypothetical protein
MENSDILAFLPVLQGPGCGLFAIPVADAPAIFARAYPA